MKGKLVSQWRQECRKCSFTVPGDSKHECFKTFCNYCNKKQLSVHFCYVAPLKLSKLTNRFMYVYFDTDCTQDFEKHDGFFEYNRKLIFAQKMCSNFEAVDDLSVDCTQCGKRTHMSWAE